jgi:hypothetical protein
MILPFAQPIGVTPKSTYMLLHGMISPHPIKLISLVFFYVAEKDFRRITAFSLTLFPSFCLCLDTFLFILFSNIE